VTVIRAEDFADRFVTLADLLEESVGVRVRSYGGINSFATVSIRGSSSDQVAVFVDGVPLNSPLGGGVNIADIPLAGVETIEIHRGFAPASLGASSIGGAVNIRTRSPAGKEGGSAAVSYGSYSTAGLTAQADLPAGRWAWAASAEGTTTEGDFTYLDDNATPFTTSDDNERVRINNASWSSGIRLRGDRRLDAGRNLAFSAEWQKRRQGVPGIDAYQSATATYALERWLLRAFSEMRGLGSRPLDLEAGIDYENTSQAFDDSYGKTSIYPQDSTTQVSGFGARARLSWRPRNQRISILVEPRLELADSNDRLHPAPDPRELTRTTLSLVGEDEVRLGSGRALVSPSLRYDVTSDRAAGGPTSAAGSPDHRLDALSGRLGGLLVLSPHWSLRGNVGRYYRVPSLLELFGNDGTVEGNATLHPERGVNADVGVALHAARAGDVDRISFEIAAFRTDADDLIQLVPVSPTTIKPVNVGRARITGLEASFGARFFGRLTASASGTWQEPILLSGTYAGGSDLPYRPRLMADTSVTLSLGQAALIHRFSYVGENEMGFSGGLGSGRTALTTLPPRYLHDAGVHVRLGTRAGGSLEVINIFDRHVVDVARYPLPGRMIVARFSTSFGANGRGPETQGP
jgi:iron complex outermembrane receptor protein